MAVLRSDDLGVTWQMVARPPLTGGGRLGTDVHVLLGSDTDDRIGWLRTGRALASIVLILTEAGLVSQPLGPATDVPATRAQLQRSLGLLGHPQMLMRLGYVHGEPHAGRRPVDQTLTIERVG